MDINLKIDYGPENTAENTARKTKNMKNKIITNHLPTTEQIIFQNYDILMVIGAFSLVAFYLLLMLLSSSERRNNNRRNGARIGERGQLIRRVNNDIRHRGENTGIITDPNIINENMNTITNHNNQTNNAPVRPRQQHEFNESMPSIARMRSDPNQDQQVTDRLIDIDQERRRRLARRNITLLRREIKKAVKKRAVRQRIGEEILAMETEDEGDVIDCSSSKRVGVDDKELVATEEHSDKNGKLKEE